MHWTPTSFVRELELLLSHTVHHYALVAVMCRLEGNWINLRPENRTITPLRHISV